MGLVGSERRAVNNFSNDFPIDLSTLLSKTSLCPSTNSFQCLGWAVNLVAKAT